MSAPRKPANLSMVEESHVLALIARGDKVPQIQAEMKAKFETDVSRFVINRIKKTNQANLIAIQNKAQRISDANAFKIKQKANTLIEKKLDNEATHAELLTKASQDYIDGNISHKDYTELVKSLKSLSVGELTTISKEMHTQAQEQPQETSTEHMKRLAEAIENGDEVKLREIVFNDNQRPTT